MRRVSRLKIMKFFISAIFILLYGSSFSQDPWKNIYSHQAWEKRDQWQKPDELIKFLKVSSGSHVADIGSHEGYMTFKLAETVGASGSVYAVDVDGAKLEKLKKYAIEKRVSQIKTIKGDYDNPKLPSNTVDAVIILDTYHEMDDHDKILQHVKNALRRGGRLLICDPIADERRKLSRSEQERKHELAMQFAVEDLTKAGFKIVYKKDPYIDRTKEKGDKMWVVVGEKE